MRTHLPSVPTLILLSEISPHAFFRKAILSEGSTSSTTTFNTYIALIRMRSKRFTSIVLQYELEI